MLPPKLKLCAPLIHVRVSENSFVGELRRLMEYPAVLTPGPIVALAPPAVALVSVNGSRAPFTKMPFKFRLKPPWFSNCADVTSPRNSEMPPTIAKRASLTRFGVNVERNAVELDQRFESC